jgi:hypothetical protein
MISSQSGFEQAHESSLRTQEDDAANQSYRL